MHCVGLIAASLVAAIVATSAAAQQTPLSPAESDPVKQGIMIGSPPAPDKRVSSSDGSFYQFPKSRWSFAHNREFYPTSTISRGNGPVSVLPRAIRSDLDRVSFKPLDSEQRMTWASAFENVYGDAVLILHRGQIVYERYNGVMTPSQPHIEFSVTKSYFGTMVETLIARGQIIETELVSKYIPELKDSAFGDATVRQVLDMTTGLDYSEDYTSATSGVAKFGMAIGVLPRPANYSGANDTYQYLPTIQKAGEHGRGFTYKSVNTQVLGWLIARVTQKRPQDVLSEMIWSKLGAEHDADISIDAAGMPFTAGGLSATLRDTARFGEMIRLNGRFNGRQIIPASVVQSIRRGANKSDFASAGYRTLPGWSYKSQWWISHNANGAFMARGIHGQAIYIDPKAEMVIVRFASNPQASNIHFDNISLPAYQAIADKLMQRR